MPVFPPSAGGFLALVVLRQLTNADGAKFSDYLYRGYNDTDPVIDFYKAEPFEYPTFLNSTNNGPRVIEFYAPWCPHCQHFKPTYVKLARDVHASSKDGANVQFYAVSCTAHGPICRDEDVKGYPCIKVYKAGEANGEKVKNRVNLNVDLVLSQLGLGAENKEADEGRQNGNIVGKSSEKNGRDSQGNEKAAPTKEEIAASTYKRAKADVFSDASLSLDFSFHNAIFMSKGPLSTERKDALREWIELLKYALPADMKQSNEQIDAVAQNFDKIVLNEDTLKETISQVRFERDDWSLACTHGHPHKGYTCGLWELFHVVAVGVVETNEWQPSNKKVSTGHAAAVIRNFIEHFFGCEECRENFLKMYDECMIGRCQRLSTDASLPREKNRELPLWLWEVHNAVNVRLLHERRARENKSVPTEQDDMRARWPDAIECPHCRKDDGTWDKSEVYMYLRSEYWTLHFNRKKLRQRVQHMITHEGEIVDSSVALISHSFVLPLAALLVMGIVWFLLQKQQKDLVGLSKKSDSH